MDATVTTPVVVSAEELLTHAADLLEEFGWCQGQSGSKELGVMCLDESLRVAYGDLGGVDWEWPPGLIDALETVALVDRDWINWNDEPGRTKEEVVAALRTAASAAAVGRAV